MPGNFDGVSFASGLGNFDVDSVPRPSGGIPRDYQGPRRRTEEEVRHEREAYGILPKTARIIEDVAARQAESLAILNFDEQQRFEELLGELTLEKIEWEGRYLELLNLRREALIDEEIAFRLRRKLQEEEDLMILFLLTCSVA